MVSKENRNVKSMRAKYRAFHSCQRDTNVKQVARMNGIRDGLKIRVESFIS